MSIWMWRPYIYVHSSKLKQGNLQYHANVALKFNAKLGGVNHTLDKKNSEWLNAMPTMIVGMDVTQPRAVGEARRYLLFIFPHKS